MKIEKQNKKARREFFYSLYTQAKSSYADVLDALERNMNQYRGSREIDCSTEAAGAVRNITYEIIESQVSSTIPFHKAICHEESLKDALYSSRFCRGAHCKRRNLP